MTKIRSNADITADQLREMVAALGRAWLVRMIPTSEAERFKTMNYTGAQLMRATGYLRYGNRNGCHVYGRPDTNRHVLVDDVHVDALDALSADGLHPAVVVETSEGLFHAWVTLSRDDFPDALAAAAARTLVARYGGDPCSAKARQLGRLPGFTNRKEQHERHGQYPFTKIARPVRPGVAPGAEALLREAEERVKQGPTRTLSDTGFTSLDGSTPWNGMSPQEAREIYEECAEAVRFRHGASAFDNDRSRLDFAVACSLAASGFDERDAVAVLMYGSDKAAERGDAYVKLSVRKAYASVAAELRE